MWICPRAYVEPPPVLSDVRVCPRILFAIARSRYATSSPKSAPPERVVSKSPKCMSDGSTTALSLCTCATIDSSSRCWSCPYPRVVSYEPVTRGKAKVVGIILRWDQASPESRAAAARELETSRVGRKARRENMVEQIVDIAPAIEKIRFPRDGDIRGTPFEVIARASLPSPARDYGMVGLDFYKWAIKENVPTVGDKVTEIFAGFCARQKPES